ncbi:MAG: hypothetical protein ACI835_004127 [Planctomycetota bacterium]
MEYNPPLDRITRPVAIAPLFARPVFNAHFSEDINMTRSLIAKLGTGFAAVPAALCLASLATASTLGGGHPLINEVDADTEGSDAMEFVELWHPGGSFPLDGYVVVFFNGSSDTSYNAFDLDGYSTNASGYFLLGNPDVVPTPEITFPGNGLQNGADAVALYLGDATDFPSATPVTTLNLVDAVVYDTDDSDDAGLLALLGGCCQLNEDEAGNKDFDSVQRCPNGAGGQLNSSGFAAKLASPGGECSLDATFENYCVSFPNSVSAAGAGMDHTGSGSIGDNDTVLVCNNVPNNFGIFYFGTDQAFTLPFGNGVQCVAQPLIRLNPVSIPTTPNTAEFALDFLGTGPEAQIIGGSTWNFQYWYRDPGQGAGMNTSDGLSASFAP